MNETTNRNIEQYLKNNRYVKYDEINKIMATVDRLTEWKDQQQQQTKEEPVLRELFTKSFEVPVWVMCIIAVAGFLIGMYM